jgi:hypothetical protein
MENIRTFSLTKRGCCNRKRDKNSICRSPQCLSLSFFCDRSQAPAGSCTVWSTAYMQTVRCVKTMIWITTRTLSSAAATVTRRSISSAFRASFSSTSSPFRSMRSALAATGHCLIRRRSSRARRMRRVIMVVDTTHSGAS